MHMAQMELPTLRRSGHKSARIRAIVKNSALALTSSPVRVRSSRLTVEGVEPRSSALEEFGEWGSKSHWSLPRGEFRVAIARWMALNGVGSTINDNEWARCRAALPGAFKAYRTFRLYTRSFFLPAAEAVFEVLENPVSFPETPPDPILKNFLRGISLYRDAKFFYLEPVVKIEGRKMTPLLRPGLEEEIRVQQDAVQLLLNERGWRFRTEERAARLATTVGNLSLELTALLISGGMTMVKALFTSSEKLRLEMKALEPEMLQGEAELRQLLADAHRLTMTGTAEVFHSRLRKFDPIITFEVNGVHLLAGHWFHLTHDGKTVLKWHD